MSIRSPNSKIMLLICIALVIIIGLIIIVTQKGKEYTFEEGFNALQEIDSKYDTSFRTERLNVSMPPSGVIPSIIKDIQSFESALDKKSSSPEVKALFLFTDIRKLMLTSEWYFQKGAELGDKGLVNDQAGFSCNEAQDIITAAFNFNETYIYGLKAEEEIDDLLFIYKYHPKLWSLVGINENKPRFYGSDLKSIRHIPLNNLKSLEVYCKISGIKHETTYTAPFKYIREEIPADKFK